MTNLELENCINKYGTDIYSFCKYITADTTQADDLYQDTFLKAMELSEKIEYDKNPKSYLLSIAVRLWNNRKRKYAWRRRIADIQPLVEEESLYKSQSQEASIEDQIISKEEKKFVNNAINSLPQRFKVILLLYYMEDLSVLQIADILNIPNGTVKSRLYKARKLLKKELEDIIDEK